MVNDGSMNNALTDARLARLRAIAEAHGLVEVNGGSHIHEGRCKRCGTSVFWVAPYAASHPMDMRQHECGPGDVGLVEHVGWSQVPPGFWADVKVKADPEGRSFEIRVTTDSRGEAFVDVGEFGPSPWILGKPSLEVLRAHAAERGDGAGFALWVVVPAESWNPSVVELSEGSDVPEMLACRPALTVEHAWTIVDGINLRRSVLRGVGP